MWEPSSGYGCVLPHFNEVVLIQTNMASGRGSTRPYPLDGFRTISLLGLQMETLCIKL